jgi:hypothetical protein
MASHSGYRSRVFLLTACASALLVCRAADAQTIRGSVVDDSTRRPLQGAVLTLVDSRGKDVDRPPVRTDSLGQFAVHASGPGQYAIRVTRIGYTPLTSQPVSLAAGEALTLSLSLSATAQRLGTVVVAEKRRLNGNELLSDLGFELRRSKQSGHFLDTVDLEVYKSHVLSDLLIDHPGLNIVSFRTPRGDEVRMQNGLDSRGAPKLCSPEIWIDGFQSVTAQARLAGLAADELYGIEVFSALRLPPASIAGWLGSDQIGTSRRSLCGIIVVWTKRFIADLKERQNTPPPP